LIPNWLPLLMKVAAKCGVESIYLVRLSMYHAMIRRAWTPAPLRVQMRDLVESLRDTISVY